MPTSVTKISPSHSKFRILMLFQSHRQALSWFISVTFLLSIIFLISVFFELKEMPAGAIFLSVILGSSFSLIFAMRFEFFIHPGNEDLKKIIIEEIYMLGYEKFDEHNSIYRENRFKQKGPTWLSWRESDFIIKNETNGMKIIGPLLLIWKIRTHVFKKINATK